MIKVKVIHDGKEVEIEVKESELPKNWNACTPGDIWCKDHIKYECNGKGEWVKIGNC